MNNHEQQKPESLKICFLKLELTSVEQTAENGAALSETCLILSSSDNSGKEA